jgi:hypothetical protein
VAARRLTEVNRRLSISRPKERAVILQREKTLFVFQHLNNFQKAVYAKFKEKGGRQASPTFETGRPDVKRYPPARSGRQRPGDPESHAPF